MPCFLPPTLMLYLRLFFSFPLSSRFEIFCFYLCFLLSPLVCPSLVSVAVKAIEEVVAKHNDAKQVTAELTNNVAAARDDLSRIKKDNNNIKDRVATAQAALNRAEVRGSRP